MQHLYICAALDAASAASDDAYATTYATFLQKKDAASFSRNAALL
jgi:hypothetical protein